MIFNLRMMKKRMMVRQQPEEDKSKICQFMLADIAEFMIQPRWCSATFAKSGFAIVEEVHRVSRLLFLKPVIMGIHAIP